jgi:hypothetical protein
MGRVLLFGLVRRERHPRGGGGWGRIYDAFCAAALGAVEAAATAALRCCFASFLLSFTRFCLIRRIPRSLSALIGISVGWG